MVGPFKGKKSEYQCPLCGRYASERNRYCSECFLVNPDQSGKPRSINVLMKPPYINKPIPTVQLVAVIAIGFLVVMGAFMIWDKQHRGTTPTIKDAPLQMQQPTGEVLPYHKFPTPPSVPAEKTVDKYKDTIQQQWQDQSGQEGMKTNDTYTADELKSTKSTQPDLNKTPDLDRPADKQGTDWESGDIIFESEINGNVRE